MKVNMSLYKLRQQFSRTPSAASKEERQIHGQESGVFDVVFKNTEINYKNTEIRLRAY